MAIKDTLSEDLKTAMRAREADRVMVYRLIFSEIKQKEVDTRETLEDAGVLAILEKMIKQRKDSISQFQKAARDGLVRKEEAELQVIQSYVPKAFSAEEVQIIINDAISHLLKTSGVAKGPALMGQVIAYIRPLLAGKADMGTVSGMVKKSLSP